MKSNFLFRQIDRHLQPKRKKIRFALVGLGHIAQVAVLPGFKPAKHAEPALVDVASPHD